MNLEPFAKFLSTSVIGFASCQRQNIQPINNSNSYFEIVEVAEAKLEADAKEIANQRIHEQAKELCAEKGFSYYTVSAGPYYNSEGIYLRHIITVEKRVPCQSIWNNGGPGTFSHNPKVSKYYAEHKVHIRKWCTKNVQEVVDNGSGVRVTATAKFECLDNNGQK